MPKKDAPIKTFLFQPLAGRVLALFLFLLCTTSVAALDMRAAGDNLDAEREDVLRFLEDLGSNPGGGGVLGGSPGEGQIGHETLSVDTPSFYSTGRPRRQFCDLRQAGKSPSRVNASEQMMTALASMAAQSIGSPVQGSLAQSLQSYGSILAASPNSTLSVQGGLMQEEASAVNLGDAAEAQSFVTAMQQLPSESALAPSSEDQAWIAALQQWGVSVASGVAGSLGQTALQTLLQSLGGASTGGASLLGPILSALQSKGSGNSGLGGSLGGDMVTGGQSGSGGQFGASLVAPVGATALPLNPGSGSASGGALPNGL